MPTENTAKMLKYHLLTLVFSKQNGFKMALNYRTSQRKVLAKKKNVDVMIRSGYKAFCLLSDKLIGTHFKYFKLKPMFKTARESHDFNINFRSFDNGFKQLCVTTFMQEYSLMQNLL